MPRIDDRELLKYAQTTNEPVVPDILNELVAARRVCELAMPKTRDGKFKLREAIVEWRSIRYGFGGGRHRAAKGG